MNERDVETAYIEWVNAKEYEKVLGRQIRLPFGTLDVLSVFVNDGGCDPHVAEIKLGKVDDKALTQVMGYADQVEVLVSCNVDVLDGNSEEYTAVNCARILVGTEMTPMVQRIYQAFGVRFVRHIVNHGGIEFIEETTAGMYGGNTDISGSLARLAAITKAWRTDHRRRNAASLHTWDNYTGLLNARSRNYFDTIPNSVAYWKRKP